MNSDLCFACLVVDGSNWLQLVLLQELGDQHVFEIPIVPLMLLICNTFALVCSIGVGSQAHGLYS
jgi:hypothetical protein